MLSKTSNTKTAMLVCVPKRFYELQRLHVFDKGQRNSISGI